MPDRNPSQSEQTGLPEEATPHPDPMELRRRAEEEISGLELQQVRALSPDETQRALHELRVHQIELEMQNEELRRVQAELDASRLRYFDLYDLAPVGYCALSETGQIMEANLTAATLLGVARSVLLSQPLTQFVVPEDQDIYYLHRKHLFETGEPQACELRMAKPDGASFWVRLEATVARNEETGVSVCRVVMSDITKSKQAEERLHSSEELYRTLVESLGDGINVKDVQGRYVLVNTEHSRRRGLPSNEIVGKTAMDIYPEEIARRIAEEDALVLATGTAIEYERELDTAFGPRIYDMHKVALRDTTGAVVGIVSTSRDVTERKQSEMGLQESEASLQSVLESTADGILAISSENRVIFSNQRFAELWKIPPAVIASKDDAALLQHVLDQLIDPQGFLQQVQELYQSEEESFDTLYFKDGRVFERLSRPLIFGDKPSGRVWSFRDITERKLAEEAIKQSEEMLRGIFASAPDSITVTDRDGKITLCNQATASMRGYLSTEQLIGKTFYELVAEEDRQRAMADMERVLMLGAIKDVPFIAQKSNGERFEAELSVSVLRDDQGATTGFVGVTKDVTERNRAAEALRESEDLYRALVESLEDGVTVIDTHGRYKLANSEALRRWGIATMEEALDKTISELFPPEVSAQLDAEMTQIIEAGKLSRHERHGIAPEGPEWVELRRAPVRNQTGEVTAVVTISRDITERKRAEEQLRQSVEQTRVALQGTIGALSKVFEVRDPYTSGHQIRVSKLAVTLATKLGLPEDEIQGIKFASVIHDLGKMQIPSEILNKPGKLSRIEMMMIRSHPESGFDMLQDIAFPWPIAEIVLQHHERMDGSGSPNGLVGDHICLAARIIAVADVVEAMASHRPYRASLGLEAALSEIEQNSGTLYDAKVTAACLALFRDQGYQFG